MIRAMMSVLLPAGNGTIRRIGRSGHPASPVCATAALPRRHHRAPDTIDQDSHHFGTSYRPRTACRVVTP